MAQTWIGGESKPTLKLDGKKVITKDIGVYDGGFEPAMQYRKQVILHFESEDKAMEYYYKKR